MRNRVPGFCMILACALALPAWALWRTSTITPESIKESGFSVTATHYKDDLVNVTVARDMSKVHQPTDREFVVRPSAALQIFGASGLIARCPVQAKENEGNVSFEFYVGKAYAADAHLTVYESIENRDPGRQREEILLIGGAMYEIQIGPFAPKE